MPDILLLVCLSSHSENVTTAAYRLEKYILDLVKKSFRMFFFKDSLDPGNYNKGDIILAITKRSVMEVMADLHPRSRLKYN